MYKIKGTGRNISGTCANLHICSTSLLFDQFIEKDGNEIDVKVRGGRQLENCLVVPATYFVCEIKKRQRGKAAHMNIKLTEISKNY